MKIGIDAHAAERDGTGNCTYIRNLLGSLIRMDDRNEYVLYAADLRHPFYRAFAFRGNVRLREPSWRPCAGALLRIPLWLALQSYRDRLDILHVQYVAPPFHRGKLVATIHDLGFLHVPETFSPFEVWRSRILVRRTARRASRVITGSSFSRQDILEQYRLPPGRVDVVTLGAGPGLTAPVEASATLQILDFYGIRKPYILCLGRLNPRKNLGGLVRAFAALKTGKNPPHTLVIVGRRDFDTGEILRDIQNSPASKDVVVTGYVPDEHLPALYSEADVFLYPSFFEGFGLPVLEAMSLGVPVITSDSSSLRETAGDAALLVDPRDPESIRAALERLTGDAELRRTYSERGRIRAGEFSWEAAAARTLEIYERVCGEPSGPGP
jgi:glycosyltransferase involved in cell wall biosynthesis